MDWGVGEGAPAGVSEPQGDLPSEKESCCEDDARSGLADLVLIRFGMDSGCISEVEGLDVLGAEGEKGES